MEREPARRYATAAAFAADLGNVLHRQPIAARRPGVALRARRARAAPSGVSVALALGVLLADRGARGLRVAAARSGATLRSAAQARARAELAARARRDPRLPHAGRRRCNSQNVPGAEKLRKELLEQAVRAYEEIFAEEDTPEVRVELAFALEQLGAARGEPRRGRSPRARALRARARAARGRRARRRSTTPARALTHATSSASSRNFEAANGAARGVARRGCGARATLWEAVARGAAVAAVAARHLNSLLSLADSPDVPLAEATALTERIVPLAESLAPSCRAIRGRACAPRRRS